MAVRDQDPQTEKFITPEDRLDIAAGQIQQVLDDHDVKDREAIQTLQRNIENIEGLKAYFKSISDCEEYDCCEVPYVIDGCCESCGTKTIGF